LIVALLPLVLISGCGLLTVGIWVERRTEPVTSFARTPPPLVVESRELCNAIAVLTSDVRVGKRSDLRPGELFIERQDASRDPWWQDVFFLPLDIVFLVPDLLIGFPLVGVDRSELVLSASDRERRIVRTGSSSVHRFTIGTIVYELTAGDLGFYRARSADLGAALQDLIDSLE
jgi:hypothetical protein